jgi:hypothetical protein
VVGASPPPENLPPPASAGYKAFRGMLFGMHIEKKTRERERERERENMHLRCVFNVFNVC